MVKWRSTLLGLLGFLVVPSSIAAQGAGSWDLTPHVGVYHPISDLGPAAPVSTARYLDLRSIDRAMSFGLLLNLGLSIDGLAVSFRGLVTLPAEARGALNCYPGLACPAILLSTDAESWNWSGMAGLLYHPFGESWVVRPFLVAGGGLKQTRFSWPKLNEWGVVDSGHSETNGALQFGVGLDVRLGGMPIRFEVVDIWTPEGDAFDSPDIPEGFSSLRPLRRGARHDLNVSLGWVLSFG